MKNGAMRALGRAPRFSAFRCDESARHQRGSLNRRSPFKLIQLFTKKPVWENVRSACSSPIGPKSRLKIQKARNSLGKAEDRLGLVRAGRRRGRHYRTRNHTKHSSQSFSIMAAIVQAQCAMRIAPVASTKASGRASLKAGFAGKPVQAASVSLSSRRAERLVVRAEEAKAPAKAEKKEEAPWSPPKLNPNTPSPIFGGSTGGLLRKAQVSTGIFFLLAATRSVERGSEPRMTRGAVVDRGRKPPTRRARR